MRLTLYVMLGALRPLSQSGPGVAAELRDGAHDFEFNFGTWHTHIKLQTKLLTGSTEFIEMNVTVTVRKVWGGRAQLEEIEVAAPTGHWEGVMNLMTACG
jgi:hypothetical protein